MSEAEPKNHNPEPLTAERANEVKMARISAILIYQELETAGLTNDEAAIEAAKQEVYEIDLKLAKKGLGRSISL